MSASPTPLAQQSVADARLAQIENRLAELEAFVGYDRAAAAEFARVIRSPADAEPAAPRRREDELELELGQNWFARVGIVALAAGGGFLLTQPYPQWHAAAPGIAGILGAGLLFVLAHASAKAFELVSRCVRGAAMALLYLATLRLFFFGAEPALSVHGFTGRLLLILVVALNLTIAWRRQSVWLAALALITGYLTALVVGSAWLTLGLISLCSLIAAAMSQRRDWAPLTLVGMVLAYGAYLGWAWMTRGDGAALLAVQPPLAPAILLLNVLVLGVAGLLGSGAHHENSLSAASALTNCLLGYGLFLLHTLTAHGAALAPAHLAAFVLFLGMAVLYSVRSDSRIATFLYAMTGYAALSIAILKLARTPDVFVWLSLQSIVVLTSAIWFRSRFIVVANFFIYAGIVLAYMATKETETGISLGFGVVALVSARILNWKRHRLELETERMRNIYLMSAFLVFPYALYHMVPAKLVALAWVGLAVAYYVLNLIVRNQKYRWMGHLTLLLTSLYIVIIGISQFGPTLRVVSFLALGLVLLVVSLTFTRLRLRQARDNS
jgi:uncharacterized membrane protein